MGKPSFEEAVALAQTIRTSVSPSSISLDGHELRDREGGPLSLTEAVVQGYWRGEHWMLPAAIHRSQEDRAWWDAADKIAQEYDRLGDPMPPELARWMWQRSKRPAKPGRSMGSDATRNLAIVMAVQLLVDRGFNPTQNKRLPRKSGRGRASSKGGSACDAVGVAFGMHGYKSVEKVWNASTESSRQHLGILGKFVLLHAIGEFKKVVPPDE